MSNRNTELELTTEAQLLPNTCYVQPFIRFYNDCGVNGLKSIESNTVKCVLTDPPYLYLKNQKLEREFDEKLYFSEVRRVLSDDGFIILFGRGSSFYRWNTILEELGFVFKEEIVWDKCRTSSPVNPIARKHELIVIYAKKNASINKVRVPFIEKYKHEPEKIKETINRIATTFGNRNTFELLKKYYESGYKEYNKSVDGFCVTRAKGSTKSLNRTIDFAVGLEEGISEQSIIKEVADHHGRIHPTQKPTSLLKRLLALTTNKGDLVIDNFAGSCSTGIACQEMERQFIGWEIDKEYYEKAFEKLKSNHVQLGIF